MEHVPESEYLARVRLKLYLKLFELGEFKRPLQVLHLRLLQSHVALQVFDPLAELSVLLDKLCAFRLGLHLLGVASPVEDVDTLELSW